jgi:hypothetical protein
MKWKENRQERKEKGDNEEERTIYREKTKELKRKNEYQRKGELRKEKWTETERLLLKETDVEREKRRMCVERDC